MHRVQPRSLRPELYDVPGVWGAVVMYDRYCDHNWTRDDANTMQCVKCKRRKDA